jgi:hypothetical protein
MLMSLICRLRLIAVFGCESSIEDNSRTQEQAMAIAFIARGRMLLCAEAGFKDSSGKR